MPTGLPDERVVTDRAVPTRRSERTEGKECRTRRQDHDERIAEHAARVAAEQDLIAAERAEARRQRRRRQPRKPVPPKVLVKREETEPVKEVPRGKGSASLGKYRILDVPVLGRTVRIYRHLRCWAWRTLGKGRPLRGEGFATTTLALRDAVRALQAKAS